MPKFTVTALEKFAVRTVYRGVEAENQTMAEVKCQNGLAEYDDHTIEEGDEQWIETLEVEQDDPTDDDGGAVVVVGNAFDGLMVYGPFSSAEDANDWADTLKNEEWHVVRCEVPTIG